MAQAPARERGKSLTKDTVRSGRGDPTSGFEELRVVVSELRQKRAKGGNTSNNRTPRTHSRTSWGLINNLGDHRHAPENGEESPAEVGSQVSFFNPRQQGLLDFKSSNSPSKSTGERPGGVPGGLPIQMLADDGRGRSSQPLLGEKPLGNYPRMGPGNQRSLTPGGGNQLWLLLKGGSDRPGLPVEAGRDRTVRLPRGAFNNAQGRDEGPNGNRMDKEINDPGGGRHASRSDTVLVQGGGIEGLENPSGFKFRNGVVPVST